MEWVNNFYFILKKEPYTFMNVFIDDTWNKT